MYFCYTRSQFYLINIYSGSNSIPFVPLYLAGLREETYSMMFDIEWQWSQIGCIGITKYFS